MGLALVTKCITSYSQRRLDKAVLAVNVAAKASYALYITNKKEHGSCRQYNVWTWPELQNASPVTAKED